MFSLPRELILKTASFCQVGRRVHSARSVPRLQDFLCRRENRSHQFSRVYSSVMSAASHHRCYICSATSNLMRVPRPSLPRMHAFSRLPLSPSVLSSMSRRIDEGQDVRICPSHLSPNPLRNFHVSSCETELKLQNCIRQQNKSERGNLGFGRGSTRILSSSFSTRRQTQQFTCKLYD